MKTIVNLSTLGLLAIFGATLAHADATTVSSSAVIYSAGNQGSVAASANGSGAGYVVVPVGTSYFTFSVSGTVSLNGLNGNYNDPDGVGAAVSSSSESGAGGISGINAPNAGYLVGVFLAPGGPGTTPPTALDFSTGTSFASLSPELDQVFFIGDGKTGDGTGATQTFYAPTGATQLYLGISDACGYNGGPSCYGDNFGNFTVDYTPVGSVVTTPAVPEPSSLVLLGTGALGLLGAARRRFKLA